MPQAYFFNAAAWLKTLLTLQVWNLSAVSGQIMRAAGCSFFDSF
jgi:hypothetical protein